MPLKSEDILNYLEKPRSIRTLLCLAKSENKGLDEILKEIGGSKSTGMARISELMKLGLVTKKASQTERRKMLYYLEDKGIKIAKELQKIIKFYQESK
jgi:DNA-binding MarR family transcriptional regulator